MVENTDLTKNNFSISSYLNNSEDQTSNHDFDAYHPDQATVQAAIEWSQNSMIAIISDAYNLDDLEKQWIEFTSECIDHRRKSDWKSLELFGMTNKDHYDAIKSILLKHDLNTFENPSIEKNIDKVPVSESYIDHDGASSYYKDQVLNYGSDEIDRARRWSKESNRIIITPTRTIAELEFLWIAFQTMTYKHRRESDWKSLVLFGVSNLKHYEYLKAEFLKNDIKAREDDFYGPMIESSQMITRDYLKNNASSMYFIEAMHTILGLKACNNSIFEELLTNNILSDVIDGNTELFRSVPNMDIPYGDLPYLSPEEMIDMGVFGQNPADNYYGVLADNKFIDGTITVSEWFELYKLNAEGFYTEFANMTSIWVNKVRELTFGLSRLKESGDESAIAARKQSILELGWNPEIEFDSKARVLAREMAIQRQVKIMQHSTFIDLQGFESSANQNLILKEASNAELKPVFVVLSEGKALHSEIIKKVTHTIYSHASIAFDPSLKKMYSFTGNNNKNKRGGFTEETIDNIPNGGRIGVFTFFVSSEIFSKLQDIINSFKDNIQNTAYSLGNLITYLFNIPFNKDWEMICSQFVDRCLKLAGIDITHKDSSLISPADLDKKLKSERRIYTVYKGLASAYNEIRIAKLINGLITKAKPIKETSEIFLSDEHAYVNGIIANIMDASALLEMHQHINLVSDDKLKSFLETCLFDILDIKPYIEAKEFPIQFDSKGNLLVRSLKRIDFEEEFSKSHKLLKQYKDSDNIDGIKYEISKLWMMLCLLEECIHGKSKINISAEDAYDAKAKINNDFQYYLKYVLSKDSKFNFTEYFEESPFNSGITKINKTTLDAVSAMIKKFVKPL